MKSIEQILSEQQTSQEEKEPVKLTGLPSGFRDLDKHTLGFQNGQLTILAARPGMGTTAFALNIARNISKTETAVAIFALDQEAERLAKNILKAELQTTHLRKEHFDAQIAKTPIYIDDTQCLSVFDLMVRAADLTHNKGVGFIIIDYLQLITGLENFPKEKNDFEAICRLLNILAKSLNIPILLISDLTRKVDMQSGYKIPKLIHLYEYGAIEKYADTVIFLYRWEYYGIDTDWSGHDSTNRAEIIIAKNSNDLSSRFQQVQLHNDFKIARFYNHPHDLPIA